MNFLSQFISRLKSQSPAFFVKLQWISGILAFLIFMCNRFVAGNLITFTPYATLWIAEITKDATFFFTAVWGTSFLPCESANETAAKQ